LLLVLLVLGDQDCLPDRWPWVLPMLSMLPMLPVLSMLSMLPMLPMLPMHMLPSTKHCPL
jgi:hypothetical protein